MKLIGISGKAGSGKDWLFRSVLRPAGWHKYALAWPLKCEGMAHGFTFAEMHGENRPNEARVWMQQRGTEEGWKKHGTAYWLRQAEGWLRILREEFGAEKIAITDVRFPHEAHWIQDAGGVLIRMCGSGIGSDHSSETALDNFTEWDAILEYMLPSEVARERIKEFL